MSRTVPADAAPPLPATTQLETLLRRCALRDRAAFEQLYRLASPRLLACLLAILRRRDLAEDALQECFVRIWSRAGQFDAYRGRALAWLVSIARYHAIDLLRAGRSTVALSESLTAVLDDPAATLALEIAESTRTNAALTRCLEALPAEQRRSVVLAYSHGLTHEDIAQRLSSPLGTVKSWVRRGLQALRRCMQP
jgi:RNA polymerase sigma-70 factor (ECF subfamily)